MALLVLGFVILVVLLTSLIKNVGWSSRQKNLVAVGLSVIGAAITVVLSKGGLESVLSADLLETIVLVYGGSQALYEFILRGTKVENSLAQVGQRNQVAG